MPIFTLTSPPHIKTPDPKDLSTKEKNHDKETKSKTKFKAK